MLASKLGIYCWSLNTAHNTGTYYLDKHFDWLLVNKLHLISYNCHTENCKTRSSFTLISYLCARHNHHNHHNHHDCFSYQSLKRNCSLVFKKIDNFWAKYKRTDMRRLTTGIRSEKCVVMRFRLCAKVVDCTYTNLNSIAYYTHSLYIAYFSNVTNLYRKFLYWVL